MRRLRLKPYGSTHDHEYTIRQVLGLTECRERYSWTIRALLRNGYDPLEFILKLGLGPRELGHISQTLWQFPDDEVAVDTRIHVLRLLVIFRGITNPALARVRREGVLWPDLPVEILSDSRVYIFHHPSRRQPFVYVWGRDDTMARHFQDGWEMLEDDETGTTVEYADMTVTLASGAWPPFVVADLIGFDGDACYVHPATEPDVLVLHPRAEYSLRHNVYDPRHLWPGEKAPPPSLGVKAHALDLQGSRRDGCRGGLLEALRTLRVRFSRKCKRVPFWGQCARTHLCLLYGESGVEFLL